MGYHIKTIPKGVLGEFSKIKEEFEESQDAYEQGNVVMQLIELSDLIGAIELYAEQYNVSLNDLIKMSNATHKAFKDGERI